MRPLTDLPGPAAGGVFLHAMWRTGSSYLLSRFDPLPRWRTFYEPFNGEIGSAALRARALADHERRRLALRHPAVEGGYFAVYERSDPASGEPLWRLAHPRLPLHDVYRGLSREGEALLQACCRVARAQARQPVFGFCHSGVQIGAMQAAMGGTHLYLTRDPRDQFYSYAPRDNDFFVSATLLQLLAAPRLRPWVLAQRPLFGAVTQPAWLRELPHRAAMRLGRALSRRLSLPEAYQVFYLSWLASQAAAEQAGLWTTSLARLARDPVDRTVLSEAFGVQFPDLAHRSNPVATLGLDFARLEHAVERWWDGAAGLVLSGRPAAAGPEV